MPLDPEVLEGITPVLAGVEYTPSLFPVSSVADGTGALPLSLGPMTTPKAAQSSLAAAADSVGLR